MAKYPSMYGYLQTPLVAVLLRIHIASVNNGLFAVNYFFGSFRYELHKNQDHSIAENKNKKKTPLILTVFVFTCYNI